MIEICYKILKMLFFCCQSGSNLIRRYIVQQRNKFFYYWGSSTRLKPLRSLQYFVYERINSEGMEIQEILIYICTYVHICKKRMVSFQNCTVMIRLNYKYIYAYISVNVFSYKIAWNFPKNKQISTHKRIP